MKLLICTQVMDKNDPILGFFHRWVEEFAAQFEYITVVCLKEGEHTLPNNVRVVSLGKEDGISRIKYVRRFYSYIWNERKNYDSVLVHMNQEYILLGGKFWKLMGKHIYLWRNHYAGNILTDIAVAFCTKVFCTSKYSYTARYKKTVLMPVGVDTVRFTKMENIERVPHSILSLGRVSPSKNIHVLVQALSILSKRSIPFMASIYGDALPEDKKYLQQLHDDVKKGGIEEKVNFHFGIPNAETPRVYNELEIFVNISPQGMFDKTILEAAACGCLTLTANRDVAAYLPSELILSEITPEVLAGALGRLLQDQSNIAALYESERELVSHHTLTELAERLREEMIV